jgi:initiation factor 1A
MVKNAGGKRTKGLARKTQQQSFTNRLRMSECEEEKYAIVRKLFGNSCDVLCDDSKGRLAMIAGKFSGRNKRGNLIAPGTIVLIGLRSWATVIDGKSEKCDILEIYSAQEFDQLKQRPNFPTVFLDSSMRDLFGESNASAPVDEFVFSSIDDTSNITTSSDTAAADVVLMNTGEEIDINDI